MSQRLRNHPAVVDVRSDVAVAACIEEHGLFDVLFNCAGFVHGRTILDSRPEEWNFALDLNLISMVRTIRAVLPGMLARGKGSIVTRSSVASRLKGALNRCASGTTKVAVIGLTKSVAADFVSKGVRCNAACPGTVRTPSLDERIAAQGDLGKARAAFIARQPIHLRTGHAMRLGIQGVGKQLQRTIPAP